jgi:hypothetical protein
MVVTIPCLRRSPRWTGKRSISAALLVTLVLIAITASVSIILAPAHISVVVRQAGTTKYHFENTNDDTRIRTTHLTFTLVATNNSSRTEVRYGHPMNAEIWYGPTEIAWLRTTALPSSDDFDQGSAAISKWHPPGTDACFHFDANYGYWPENAPNNSMVVVQATVWFRYGLATTLPFTVKFVCQHVNFVHGINSPIKCDAL